VKNKKSIAAIACLFMLVISILITAFYNDQPFTHQYEEEDCINNYSFSDIDDYYVGLRKVDEEDYCLDDYYFTTLAGDVMDLASPVKYIRMGNQLYIVQEAYDNCIGDSQFIIKIDPLKTVKADAGERLLTFVDYSYLSKEGRYVYILDDGGQSREDIKSSLSYFEKCLFSYDYEDDDYGHQNQLNERSFVDYFILYELAYPGYYSDEDFIIFKDMRGRIRILTGIFLNSSEKTYEDDVDYHNLISTSWYSMLSKSQIFTDAVIDEYAYLRKHALSDENVFKVLDSCADFLLNSEGIDKDRVLAEKESLSNYLKARLLWIDENINTLSGFSARSAVKEYNNTPY